MSTLKSLHGAGKYLLAVSFVAMSTGLAFAQQAAAVHPEGSSGPKIVLVGDSTVATEGGWGPGFCSLVKPGVRCVDLAANGRSTKSFIDEGRWTKALDEHANYYFIQFGHNDQKDKPKVHADAASAFKTNLRMFIRDVRAQGGVPVLVTSLSRRKYDNGVLVFDGLEQYAEATREVALEQHAPLIDLYLHSRVLLDSMTQEEADKFDAAAHPDAAKEGASAANPDRTHLNDLGKATFGAMVASEVRANVPGLRDSIQATPSQP